MNSTVLTISTPLKDENYLTFNTQPIDSNFHTLIVYNTTKDENKKRIEETLNRTYLPKYGITYIN